MSTSFKKILINNQILNSFTNSFIATSLKWMIENLIESIFWLGTYTPYILKKIIYYRWKINEILDVVLANVILKNMDRSVEPCDNFYKFACGGFLNSAAIPDDASQIDGFATYDEKITQQLRLIYDGITARNQTKHLRLAKNLYDSCMNTCEAIYHFFSRFISIMSLNECKNGVFPNQIDHSKNRNRWSHAS